MPVDPFGKLIFRNNPVNRYATPINRKPKNRRLTRLNGCLASVALVMALLAISGIHAWMVQQSQGNVNTSTPVRHTNWPTIATFTGSDMDATTKPLLVSGTWQITWLCREMNHGIDIQVLNEKNNDVWMQQVSCLQGDTDGSALITYTGQVHIEIGSAGSWVISVQEP